MSRSAQTQTRQLPDQQLSQTNAMNQQLYGQQQSLAGALGSQYQSILNNPGYSAADQAAITGQSQGALSSAYDALQQSAQNRVARTNNSAGFSELTDDLARQKGIQSANVAQQNQINFSDTAYQRQMSALQGLSGLYGVDSNLRRAPEHAGQRLPSQRFLLFSRQQPRQQRRRRRHLVSLKLVSLKLHCGSSCSVQLPPFSLQPRRDVSIEAPLDSSLQRWLLCQPLGISRRSLFGYSMCRSCTRVLGLSVALPNHSFPPRLCVLSFCSASPKATKC
jgi:hypothetical protein